MVGRTQATEHNIRVNCSDTAGLLGDQKAVYFISPVVCFGRDALVTSTLLKTWNQNLWN